MELQFCGANCIKVITKRATIVIDDNLAELGLKSVTKAGDVAVFSHPHKEPKAEVKLMIDDAGEYEVSDISIQGFAARAHMDEEGKESATIYKLTVDDISIVSLGHIYPQLSDDQLEEIGLVDILMVPVGNSGYTMDAIGALKLMKEIEPKIVIPTHYADKEIKYEVPQVELTEALKGLAMEPKEALAKFKPKPTDLTDNTQLIVLERQ